MPGSNAKAALMTVPTPSTCHVGSALRTVKVRDQAIAVTNVLGAKGHREFRDLLRDS